MGDFSRDYAVGMDAVRTDYVTEEERLAFQGIVRENGKVGTRNYIGVLATVSCSVSVARLIANGVPKEQLSRFPHVDGIVSLGHGSGCGMADDHEAFSLLQRTLAGYVRNPNFAAILLVGLGCEVNNLDCFLKNKSLHTGPALRALNIQETGGSRVTVMRGVEAITEMLQDADSLNDSEFQRLIWLSGLNAGGRMPTPA